MVDGYLLTFNFNKKMDVQDLNGEPIFDFDVEPIFDFDVEPIFDFDVEPTLDFDFDPNDFIPLDNGEQSTFDMDDYLDNLTFSEDEMNEVLELRNEPRLDFESEQWFQELEFKQPSDFEFTEV